jgi:hypothetical protein
MKAKLCIFIVLLFFAPASFAEYYLVYSASGCSGYGCPRYVSCHRHHKATHKHKKTHVKKVTHRRHSSYSIQVYYYIPSCCNDCGCGNPCGIYTGRAGHCVTYDEVMTGYRYREEVFYP